MEQNVAMQFPNECLARTPVIVQLDMQGTRSRWFRIFCSFMIENLLHICRKYSGIFSNIKIFKTRYWKYEICTILKDSRFIYVRVWIYIFLYVRVITLCNICYNSVIVNVHDKLHITKSYIPSKDCLKEKVDYDKAVHRTIFF